jgi:hypothetical protein
VRPAKSDALDEPRLPGASLPWIDLAIDEMDILRTIKLIGTSLAVASLGLTALVDTAIAGKMDALLGDWDLNIEKSTFEPQPPTRLHGNPSGPRTER